MQLAAVVNALKSSLQHPLPGREAQLKMAPSYRPDFSKEEIMRLNPKQSAVLILLFERNGETQLLFTKRNEYKGVHSGQMSFPGGKVEAGDDNIVHTALRETQEETGVQPHQLQVLGTLSELYIPPSNFMVYPVLAYSEHSPAFAKDDFEVAELVEIPLRFFLQNDRQQRTQIQLLKGSHLEVPAFVYQHYIIWGATCIVISELMEVVQRGILHNTTTTTT